MISKTAILGFSVTKVRRRVKSSFFKEPGERSAMMMFEQEDWTMFRSLHTLPQVAGVPERLIPRLVAKELVDNALDAGGRCLVGFLKNQNGFWVDDDGVGLDGNDLDVAALFSIRRSYRSSKFLRRLSRGALGNGLTKVVAGAIVATAGQLKVTTRGRILELVPQANTGITVPHFIQRLDDDGGDPDGTKIRVVFGDSLKVE